MRPTPPSIADLAEELREEQEDLDRLVAPLPAAEWAAPTPAAGWSVGDQIGHLAYFDEVATVAIEEPARFRSLADAALAAASAGEDPMAAHLDKGRAMAAAELLGWWRQARSGLLAAAARLVPGSRLEWFGPPMSPLSFLSARLMETWAHGQDVADALGAARKPTARLRHVAELGVRARPFSFAVRGLEDPPGAVRVELLGPSGEEWNWGDDGAGGLVRGPALDFCLVVTQRRHLEDTALEVEGEAARRWMAVAQAFAGPPGPGRPPRGAGGGDGSDGRRSGGR